MIKDILFIRKLFFLFAVVAVALTISITVEAQEKTPVSGIRNAADAKAQNCLIKGNVSKRNNDEKIYHCPGWRDYEKTQVNPEEGDRWFCSEKEAIAAGFRKPKNVKAPCSLP